MTEDEMFLHLVTHHVQEMADEGVILVEPPLGPAIVEAPPE